MIVLDTNVVSELMNPKGSHTVKSWARAQTVRDLFTTTITKAEILYGIAILPEGQRRQKLQTAAQETFAQDFAGRILSFDSDAAAYFAVITSSRRQQGIPISSFDAQIASICRVNMAIVATRNTKDFANCGLEIINPWEML